MNELSAAIFSESEYQRQDAKKPGEVAYSPLDPEKINNSMQAIDQAMKKSQARTCVAFSGGSDSLVLLDIVRKVSQLPIVIWADSQMEYPETRPFIEKTTASYNLDLRIARAKRTPLEQWSKTGWPMLGKMAARLWMQKNRGEEMGFSINVSECCRALKIGPARALAQNLGCGVQLTGQRGKTDDSLRGLRNIKDGVMFYQARDRIWMANPLAGWSDADIKGYIHEYNLPKHPARKRGAATIGCVYCGGGCQFTNSGYRILRKTWPEAWYRFMVEWGGGLIILSLKYKSRLNETLEAVKELGGLECLATTKPWLFDFTRMKPILGYNK